MTQTHHTPTKVLSVFLSMLMVLSTVCFFNPFSSITAKAAVDVNSTMSASDGYDLTVNIPEAVYLKPGSSSLQYFLTDTVKSTGASAVSHAATSTEVSVSSPYATNMTLSYEILSSGTDASGNTVNFSGNLLDASGNVVAGGSGSNSVSLALNDSMTYSGYSEALAGSETFIKWTLTYVADGETHTVYYYTSLYVPYLGQAGLSAHTRHDGTYANPENWSYSFVTGGHSVSGGNAASKFVSTGSVNTSATDASNAVFVAPLVSFTGGNAGSKRENVTYPFSNGGTIPWGSNFYTDAFTTAENGGVSIRSEESSSSDFDFYSGSDIGSLDITVDTSRFANYNQIPNLSVGWAHFRHDWDGGDNYLYFISGIDGTSVSSVSTDGLSGATITTNADTSRYEGNYSLARGLYALNGTVTGGEHLLVYCYRNAYKPYVGNQSVATTYAGVKLNVTAVDKANLRNLVYTTLSYGYAADMISDSTKSASFASAMETAEKVLAKTVGVTSDEITSAYKSLESAISDAQSYFDAVLKKDRARADVFAVVPETVYLKPATSDIKDFDKFLNNTLTSDGEVKTVADPSTTGTFTFKCADASKVKVTLSDASATLGSTGVTDFSQEFALTNGEISGTITGGSLTSALAEGGTCLLKWTFEYTYAAGGDTAIATAYTVAYAPLCTTSSTASGTAASFNTGNFTAELTSWITGIHSIVSSYPSGAATDGSGSTANPPLTDSNVYDPGNGDTHDSKLISGGSGANYYYRRNADADCKGGEASLVVDTSRFTNYSQIPNFTIGVDVNKDGWNNNAKTFHAKYVLSSLEFDSSAPDVSGGVNFYTQSESKTSVTGRHSTTVNQNVDSSLKKLTVSGRIKSDPSGYKTRIARAWAYCTITYTDKTELRALVNKVIKASNQQIWCTSASWSTFESAFSAASLVLGRPDATQTEIDSAKTTLKTAFESLKYETGTATATYYALIKTVNNAGVVSSSPLKVANIYLDKAAATTAESDSEAYTCSDTVTISANKFNGYTYVGYLNASSVKAIGENAVSSYSDNDASVTYYHINTDIKNAGNDTLYFYYTAPDAHLTVDLAGGVASVDNFSTDITASVGSTFTPATPTRDGYTFTGWALDGAGNLNGNTYTFGSGSATLTATWKADPTVSSELIIDPNGGTMNSEILFVENGASSASGGSSNLTYAITEADGGQSVDISGHYRSFVYGEAGACDERTQVLPLWVYLEEGKTYTISWNGSNDITEFFFFKNGSLTIRTNVNPCKSGECSVTFTAGDTRWYYESSVAEADKNATGWYQLRLDQNIVVAAEGQAASEADYTVSNLRITSDSDAKLGYRQAAETTVFIADPVKDGYNFTGWSGLVNGTLTRVDADENGENAGYLYTFKGKADTLVAQWSEAVYEIGFDNMFLATKWSDGKFTSDSSDEIGYDTTNNIFSYKNNKAESDTSNPQTRRAESSYRITGITPGQEYIISYDFASDNEGSSANDSNVYIFAHFYDANGNQINIKNSSINYGDQGGLVGKYIIYYTDTTGALQSQVTPSEWAGSETRIFSGLQMCEVEKTDGYATSYLRVTAPEGAVSMDIAFGAQHAGQTASFKNVFVSEYDAEHPVTDYSMVQKNYNKDTTVFGTVATAKKLGYQFNGWYTGKNGTGSQITSSTSTAAYHTAFTVWSNWQEITYTVTYDANGGTLASGTVNPTQYTINSDSVTIAPAPTKKGYTFKGWAVTKDTSVHADNNWTSGTVAAGTVYTDELYGDVKLTAVWEENAANVKVTLHEQNADGTYTDTVVINGKKLDSDSVDLSGYVASKTGFKAVSVTNNGSAFALTDGKFTVTGGSDYDIVITRDRLQYTFTVKYVMSDGTTAPTTVKKTLYYGQSDAVNTPSVTGYTPDKTVATVNAISADTTVTVTYTLDKHNVTVHYVYENGTTAADDKTVTVEYNKTYSVASPSITGYTADKTVVSGTMGTTDSEVTVTYKINSHKLTVIYKYAENEYASTAKEYTLKYGDTYSYATPAVDGYTPSLETVNGTMGDSDVDVTVVYTINTFTVTFKDWDGKALKTETVKWNNNATAPANPSREGYTFTGWDKTFTNIKANTEVTAQYSINTYTLSFNSNGGTTVDDITAAYGTAVTAPTSTRTGYTFSKWVDADGNGVPSIMPAENISYTAQWTPNSYTISFNSNNGTGDMNSINAVYDSDAVLPTCTLTRTGYTFSGWSTSKEGGNIIKDGTTVNNLTTGNNVDVVLYAQWTANEYTVTYRVDGTEKAVQTYKYGTVITAIENPSKTGYTFKGWKETLPATMPANNIVVDAVFEVNTYTLTYKVDGTVYKTFDVNYGDAITAIAEPSKTGYTFSGWSNVPATMPADDVTVSGTFTVNQYTVTYRCDGFDDIVKTYDYGTAVEKQAALTKTGYTFSGWTNEPDTMGAENVVVTGTFTANTYKIHFNSNGGEGDMDDMTVTYDAKANLTKNTFTKTDSVFVGWSKTAGGEVAYTDEAEVLNLTTGTSDVAVQLYAQYKDDVNHNGTPDEDDATYTVTFVNYNGKKLSEQTVLVGMSATAPAETPTRECDDEKHYTFSVWDKDFSAVTENLTVTAQFADEEHTYDEWDVTEAATCIKEGSQTHSCTFCGYTETEAIVSAGHTACTPAEEDRVEATCETDGSYNLVTRCTVCNEIITSEPKTIPAIGHKWNDGEITTAPTCTKEGVKTYTCLNDSTHTKTEAVAATGHTAGTPAEEDRIEATCETDGSYNLVTRCTVCNEIITSEPKTIPAIGHKWNDGEITTAPTCTKEGIKTFTCLNDSTHTKTEAVAATGHTAGTPAEEDRVEATCETEGSYNLVTRCTVCNEIITSEPKTIPAIGHKWNDGEITTAPTCTKEGVKTFTCLNDSTHTKTEAVKATGHDYGDATCTQAATCKTCGATSGTAIGHKWDDGVVTTAPTCTSKGVKTYTCTRDNCGATYTEDIDMLAHEMPDAYTTNNNGTHSKKCANCDYTETAECTYTDVVTAPTCTEKGYTTHTCDICGYSYVDSYVDANGHKYVDTVTAPTCTEKGYTTHVCSVCNDTYTDSETDALGHNWDSGTVTSEPSCTFTGIKTYKCQNAGCTETKTEILEVVPHTLPDTYTTNNDGTHSKKCANCDYTETADCTYTDVVTAPTCTEKGYTTHTCSVCGYSYVDSYADANGHKYVDTVTAPTCTEKGYTTHVCSVCQDTYTDSETAALGHTGGKATCKELAVCDRCGKTYGEYGSHDYGDATCTEAATCKICGQTSGDAIGHEYSVLKTKVEPTCTEKGYSVYKCVRCDETETRDYVDALGHAYDNGVVTTEPTCTEKGVKTFTCTRTGCTASCTEEVAAKGHTDGTAEKTNVVEAKCTTEGSYDLVTKCTVCGEVTKTEHKTVAATGHTDGTAEKTNVVDAKCTTEGSYDLVTKCTVCGEVTKTEHKTVAATGHNYVAVVTDPTCTEKGYTTYTCDKCADSYKADETSALGHDMQFANTVKAATCKEEGSDLYKCSHCDATQTRATAKTAHTEVVDAAKAATCTATGLTEGKHCSVCGLVIEEQETVPMIDHTVATSEYVAPTCETKGKTEGKYCSVCGTVITASTEIAATGHKWSIVERVEPTYGTEGYIKYVCSNDSTHTKTETIAKLAGGVEDITVDIPEGGKLPIIDGQENKINVNTTPADATEKIKYTSSDENVVKVDENGVVTVIGDGEAVITVETEDGRVSVDIPVSAKKLHTVTFKTNGGDTTEKLFIGDMPTAPTVESYTTEDSFIHAFKTWTVNGTKTDVKAVAGDTVYTAVYTEPADYSAVDKAAEELDEIINSGKADETALADKQAEIDALKEKIDEINSGRNTRDKDEQSEIDEITTKINNIILVIYPESGSTLEIRGGNSFYSGTVISLKAYKMPVNVETTNVKWTSSDDDIVTFANGKLYAFGEGTVTLTAESDGLKANKTINVVAGGNRRIVKFQNMNKMHYIIEGFYTVYNSGAIYWSNDYDLDFEIYTYSNFGYDSVIVYVNGKEVQENADGTYTIPAGSGNVVVTVTGAVVEDDGNGNGSKISFWEWLMRLFRKIINFFKGIFKK
jgi:uncharacterized repeat protein (TIGR02543 family)